MVKPPISLAVLIFSFSILGCAPNTPVSEKPELSVPFEVAISNIDEHIGDVVRWGGLIQRVENTENHTIVEIVETPTTDKGRPYTDKASKGRFKAQFEGFIDPIQYTEGNMLTIIGTIVGSETGKIGEFTYTYPIIKVEKQQQWDRASYELDKLRRRMNIGFGWSSGHSGVGVGWGMPYTCDIYGDCEVYFW